MNPKRYATSAVIIVIMGLIGGCQQISRPVTNEQPTSGTKIITAECIAGYYQQDLAPYITEQKHTFGLNAEYLQIASTEPTGNYTFTLNNHQFSATKKKTEFLSGLPASFVNQQLATGIYYSFTTGAGLLDTTKFTSSENIKIEGQWYDSLPISQQGNIQITLLKNINTNRIDLVEVTQIEEGLTTEKDVLYFYKPRKNRWLLKSYNYRYSKELETLVPMKIDVFDTSAGLASKKLILQFEYKRIQTQ